MTDKTESCMSGWDVPKSEMDRLADIISPQGVCSGIPLGYVGSRAELHIIIEAILTDLAENPPQCAVDALRNELGLCDITAGIGFTAAINAIRGEK